MTTKRQLRQSLVNERLGHLQEVEELLAMLPPGEALAWTFRRVRRLVGKPQGRRLYKPGA